MDFDKYRIRLNIKSMVLFERLTGKSFYEVGADDANVLMYSVLMANNPELNMTIGGFEELIKDKKIMRWLTDEYMQIEKFNAQLKEYKVESLVPEDSSSSGSTQMKMVTDVAALMIVSFGLDAHYVMYEMDMYELEPFIQAIENKRREDLENQRFWTWMSMSPHMDTKKTGGPDKLMPFPWEKGSKINKKKDLDSKSDAIKAFFKRQEEEKKEKEKKEQQDGEGRLDNRDRQQDLEQSEPAS